MALSLGARRSACGLRLAACSLVLKLGRIATHMPHPRFASVYLFETFGWCVLTRFETGCCYSRRLQSPQPMREESIKGRWSRKCEVERIFANSLVRALIDARGHPRVHTRSAERERQAKELALVAGAEAEAVLRDSERELRQRLAEERLLAEPERLLPVTEAEKEDILEYFDLEHERHLSDQVDVVKVTKVVLDEVAEQLCRKDRLFREYYGTVNDTLAKGLLAPPTNRRDLAPEEHLWQELLDFQEVNPWDNCLKAASLAGRLLLFDLERNGRYKSLLETMREEARDFPERVFGGLYVGPERKMIGLKLKPIYERQRNLVVAATKYACVMHKRLVFYGTGRKGLRRGQGHDQDVLNMSTENRADLLVATCFPWINKSRLMRAEKIYQWDTFQKQLQVFSDAYDTFWCHRPVRTDCNGFLCYVPEHECTWHHMTAELSQFRTMGALKEALRVAQTLQAQIEQQATVGETAVAVEPVPAPVVPPSPADCVAGAEAAAEAAVEEPPEWARRVTRSAGAAEVESSLSDGGTCAGGGGSGGSGNEEEGHTDSDDGLLELVAGALSEGSWDSDDSDGEGEEVPQLVGHGNRPTEAGAKVDDLEDSDDDQEDDEVPELIERGSARDLDSDSDSDDSDGVGEGSEEEVRRMTRSHRKEQVQPPLARKPAPVVRRSTRRPPAPEKAAAPARRRGGRSTREPPLSSPARRKPTGKATKRKARAVAAAAVARKKTAAVAAERKVAASETSKGKRKEPPSAASRSRAKTTRKKTVVAAAERKVTASETSKGKRKEPPSAAARSRAKTAKGGSSLLRAQQKRPRLDAEDSPEEGSDVEMAEPESETLPPELDDEGGSQQPQSGAEAGDPSGEESDDEVEESGSEPEHSFQVRVVGRAAEGSATALTVVLPKDGQRFQNLSAYGSVAQMLNIPEARDKTKAVVTLRKDKSGTVYSIGQVTTAPHMTHPAAEAAAIHGAAARGGLPSMNLHGDLSVVQGDATLLVPGTPEYKALGLDEAVGRAVTAQVLGECLQGFHHYGMNAPISEAKAGEHVGGSSRQAFNYGCGFAGHGYLYGRDAPVGEFAEPSEMNLTSAALDHFPNGGRCLGVVFEALGKAQEAIVKCLGRKERTDPERNAKYAGRLGARLHKPGCEAGECLFFSIECSKSPIMGEVMARLNTKLKDKVTGGAGASACGPAEPASDRVHILARCHGHVGLVLRERGPQLPHSVHRHSVQPGQHLQPIHQQRIGPADASELPAGSGPFRSCLRRRSLRGRRSRLVPAGQPAGGDVPWRRARHRSRQRSGRLVRAQAGRGTDGGAVPLGAGRDRDSEAGNGRRPGHGKTEVEFGGQGYVRCPVNCGRLSVARSHELHPRLLQQIRHVLGGAPRGQAGGGKVRLPRAARLESSLLQVRALHLPRYLPCQVSLAGGAVGPTVGSAATVWCGVEEGYGGGRLRRQGSGALHEHDRSGTLQPRLQFAQARHMFAPGQEHPVHGGVLSRPGGTAAPVRGRRRRQPGGQIHGCHPDGGQEQGDRDFGQDQRLGGVCLSASDHQHIPVGPEGYFVRASQSLSHFGQRQEALCGGRNVGGDGAAQESLSEGKEPRGGAPQPADCGAPGRDFRIHCRKRRLRRRSHEVRAGFSLGGHGELRRASHPGK